MTNNLEEAVVPLLKVPTQNCNLYRWLIVSVFFSSIGFFCGRSYPSFAEVSPKLWTPVTNPVFANEPATKHTVRDFDAYLMQQAAFDSPQQKLKTVEQWLTKDFVYDPVGFPPSRSVKQWCLSGEESHYHTTFSKSTFVQMLFIGTDKMATTTSYGIVYWASDLFGIPPLNGWIIFRVTDFILSRVEDGVTKLAYNFMLMDFPDLFRRAGYPILPLATLPEGHFLPPSTKQGVPAPMSVLIGGQDASSARKIAETILRKDWIGSGDSNLWSNTMVFYGTGGIGMARSIKEFREHVLNPFHTAFANRSLDTEMLDCEGDYCGAFGHLRGKFISTWLGLSPGGQYVSLRFTMHWRVANGKAVEGWSLFDIPGFYEQLGLDFFSIAKQKFLSGRKVPMRSIDA